MTDLTSGVDASPSELSLAVVHLCKGPIYRDDQERLWETLSRVQRQVSDFVAVLGLEVVIDEAEGYAYLRSQPPRRRCAGRSASPPGRPAHTLLPRQRPAGVIAQAAGRVRRH